MMLGLGVPGTIAVIGYPIVQALVLSRQFKAGALQPTSMFFVHYGHLVENYRPRLYFWGSVVELRKLALVAVVLGLQSVSSLAQLVGCWVVLLVYAWCMQGLLPYPFKLLNKLYMATNVVLLAFVWVNVLVAALGSSMSESASVALHGATLLLVGVMLFVLLVCCCRRLCHVLKHTSWAKLRRTLARGQASAAQHVRRTLSCP